MSATATLLVPSQQSPAIPPESSAAIAEALALAGAGDLDGAIAIAEALSQEDGATDEASALLGGLHVEAGHFERAAQILAPLTERKPADPGALYNAGRAAEGQGRFEDAAALYRRSIAILPHSPASRALGMLIGRFGRPEEAYAYLQPWAATHPEDTEARVAAAAGAIALERAPEAEALLEGLPKSDPGVKLLRAQVLLQQADPWGAINELQALSSAPPPAIQGAIRRTLARAYLVVGDADGALEQVEPLGGDSPQDAVLLASAYFQAGRLEEATKTLAPFAEPLRDAPPPENPPSVARDIVLEYGRYLHSDGRAAEAVPFLRLATELAPSKPDAYQALGQALAGSGKRDEARKVLDRFRVLSEQDADDVASVNQKRQDIADPTGRETRKAMEIFTAGDVEKALEALAREAQLAPADPRPAYAASAILLDAGRSEEALAAADRALAAAPGRADGLYQRGAVLMSLDRLAEAESMFREALDVQADHAAALSDYAVLLMSGGRDDEAVDLLERLLNQRPEDRNARAHLERIRAAAPAESSGTKSWAQTGRELLKARNFEAAEEPLRRAVARDPADAALRVDLASALWENNQLAEAETHAREAVALEPASAAAHGMLGGLLLWTAKYLEAAESLERATELAESDPKRLVDLGRAWDGAAREATDSAEEQRALGRAENAYRRAVEIAPEHAEAIYGLAQVVRRLGREEEADRLMERYMGLYRRDQQDAREDGLEAAKPSPAADDQR